MEGLCVVLYSLANQHKHLGGHQILALGITSSETQLLMGSLSPATEDSGVLGPASLSHFDTIQRLGLVLLD